MPSTPDQDEALIRALSLQMEVDELKLQVQQLQKDAQQAQKARDKAKHEAEQLRARNAKLSGKLEEAKKDAKQAKHQAREELQKAQAKQEQKRGKDKRQQAEGPTVTSEDGKVSVSLVGDQVHIAKPPHYVVSSTPLTESRQHQLEFCGLISGIRESEYGVFAEHSAQIMATRWRYQHNCLRVEDLELPTKVATTLAEHDLEMAADIQARLQAGTLGELKGIGPAAIELIAKVLNSQ